MVALRAPAGMVMLLLEEPLLSKTARPPLLEPRLMPTPPGGAGALRVIVAVEVWQPPMIEAGLSDILDSAGVTVILTAWILPARLAVMVGVLLTPTKAVSTTKVALRAPAGIVMLLLEEPLLSNQAVLPSLEARP